MKWLPGGCSWFYYVLAKNNEYKVWKHRDQSRSRILPVNHGEANEGMDFSDDDNFNVWMPSSNGDEMAT